MLPQVRIRLAATERDLRLQVSGYRLQVTGYRLQVTGYRLQVAGYRLQVLTPETWNLKPGTWNLKQIITGILESWTPIDYAFFASFN